MSDFSKFRKLICGISCLTVLSVCAENPMINFDERTGSVGVFHCFENPSWIAAFKVMHYDEKFKPMKQFVFDGAEMEGRLTTFNGERIPLKIQYSKKSPTEVHVKLQAAAAKPFSSSRLMYEQFMRYVPGEGVKVTINNKVYDYRKPFDPKKPYQLLVPALKDNGITTVTVDAPKGMWTIKGNFAVILQDMRQWKTDALQLRLMFSPYDGMITNSILEFDLAVEAK